MMTHPEGTRMHPTPGPESGLVGRPVTPTQGEVLTPEALAFLVRLARAFSARREHLLELRAGRREAWRRGLLPGFDPTTAFLRRAEWKVAPTAADLQVRRVEITGPAEAKTIINGLNSGADVFMADFEDAMSPTWDNLLAGQIALREAVRRTLRLEVAGSEKHYEIGAAPALLMVRPRGLHLEERGLIVDGRPIPASLFDFGLYFFHNAAELAAGGSGPYFYLPKLEHHLEARFWDEVLGHAERDFGLPTGTARATVLIETLPAVFQMDEILYELREHAAGLNCGRWDYLFSMIKVRQSDAASLFPDRAQLTMEQPCMRAYTQLLVQTCHRRGVHAIGGMAAQIPVKDDPEATATALVRVRSDKRREVNDGHDGTWVAHPALVPVALSVFEAYGVVQNQLHVGREEFTVTPDELLAVPRGVRTREGLRANLRVAIRYLESWLSGRGCVPLYHLMEDVATAEIARVQIWHWVRHRARLEDGTTVTPDLLGLLVLEEMRSIRTEVGDERFRSGRFEEARDLILELSRAEELAEFLTVAAEPLLHRTPNVSPQVDLPRELRRAEASAEGEISMSHAKANGTAPLAPAGRWDSVDRPYSREDVLRLRGSVLVEHTLARLGAERLWDLLTTEDYVHALGALTGNQAVQQVRAGLPAIYVSGWQVAADANAAGHTYPDQSLYPANSVPVLVRRINAALQRADQIEHAELFSASHGGNFASHGNGNGHGGHHDDPGHAFIRGSGRVAEPGPGVPGARAADSAPRRLGTHWFAPIVADAEAGFGGPLNAYELMKAMIEAGAGCSRPGLCVNHRSESVEMPVDARLAPPERRRRSQGATSRREGKRNEAAMGRSALAAGGS
jgi:malate synthase